MTPDKQQLPRLLVVQPSDDYACRIRKHDDDAIFVATAARARTLAHHPNVVKADLTSPGKAARAIRKFTEANGISLGGITCFVCDYLPLTAALAQILNLPFHSEESVRRSRRKDLAFVAWSSQNLPTPRTCVVSSPTQLRVFADRVPGPWILKPKQGTGSAWVVRIDDPVALEAAHWELTDGIGSEWRGETSYIAQEMARGVEVSADLFVDGDAYTLLRLTEKRLASSGAEAGVVLGYFPSRRRAAERDAIASVCHRGAVALGVTRGIVMVDVMLTENGPVLIEMALRPGGDCLPDLCLASTGYDPVAAACRAAMGATLRRPSLDAPKAVAALHLMARRGGKILSIDFSDLARDPRVLSYEPYRAVGDTLRVWKGSYDDRILAACIVHCADPRQLPGLAESVTRRIRISLSEDEPHNGSEDFFAEAVAG